jgi:hypothetical protein
MRGSTHPDVVAFLAGARDSLEEAASAAAPPKGVVRHGT